MNKEGFTLVELLAVIVILSIIAIITVPNVINIFNENKEKTKEIQINTILDAAKKYTIRHSLTRETKIYLNDLVDDKLLDKKALIDPSTNQEFENPCVVVNVGSKVTYTFHDNCSESGLDN